MPRYAWHEVCQLSPGAQADYLDCVKHPEPLSRRELLDRACDNRERSTRRARTKVRRLAKWKGLTTLLTLTYRENMLDRARMSRDLDVFIKRVKRAVNPKNDAEHVFEYICVFERQKRGAWHAHLAVRRVLSHYLHKGQLVRSYDLLRSMWRGVVGADNGNVDVSRNKKISRSAAKLAAYLSKYIGKTLGEGLDRYANSYSASGRDLPDAIVERALTSDLGGAIGALFDLIGPDCHGRELHHAMLKDVGGYWVCLSPPDRGKG